MSFRKPTGRREGVSSWMTNAQRPGNLFVEVLREKYPDTQVPPMLNCIFAAFEEYGDMPETVPLNFTEDGIT